MGLAALGTGAGTLPPGAQDPRGWRVRTLVDDRAAGTVGDLLVTGEGHGRWLVLALSTGRRVLVPAGQARADREGLQLWLPGLAADQLELLPDYDEAAALDEAAEEALLSAYTAALLRERALPARQEPLGDVASLASLPDLRVARGEPDPRGWRLLGANDEPLGRVDELLVDARALKVRHLVCTLAHRAPHRVLLPIGYARLDPGARAVRVPRLTPEAAGELPAWSDASETKTAAAEVAARLGAARPAAEDPRLDAGWIFSEST